jgi:hypothetical protein
MTGGGVQMMEDGVDRDQRPVVPGTWRWLLVGFVVGLGAGVVFFSPPVNPSPTVTTTPQRLTPGQPDLSADLIGISQVVPGFPDALVAIVETETRSLEYHLWPVKGGLVVRSLPAGTSDIAEIDQFGTWVAVSAGVAGEGSRLLSIGKPTGVSPVVSGIDSFQWHDSSSGYLSYTSVNDGIWHLWSVGGTRVPALVATDSSRLTGVLATWGDWGWAVYHPESGSFDLFNESGELRTTVVGVPLASHRSGWLLVVGEQLSMVSAGGGISAVPVPADVAGVPSAGSISPDGRQVALLGSDGLVVAEVEGGEPLHFDLDWRKAEISWTSDSRFVLIPGFRGVTVVDVENSTVQTVLPNAIVHDVGVIPLTP